LQSECISSEEYYLKPSFGNISVFYALSYPGEKILGYVLGKYLVGDYASLTKTVIASAFGGSTVNIMNREFDPDRFSEIDSKDIMHNIISAVSSGLLAYINL